MLQHSIWPYVLRTIAEANITVPPLLASACKWSLPDGGLDLDLIRADNLAIGTCIVPLEFVKAADISTAVEEEKGWWTKGQLGFFLKICSIAHQKRPTETPFILGQDAGDATELLMQVAAGPANGEFPTPSHLSRQLHWREGNGQEVHMSRGGQSYNRSKRCGEEVCTL